MLGDGESPLGDDVGENQHYREPPEVVRLLLSTRERYVFFFLLDGEVAERTTSERICEDFFCHRPEEYGEIYKKLTCTVT